MWAILSSIISGVIGPITGMVTAIYTQKVNLELEEFKVDGKVDVAVVNAAVAIAQANASLLNNKWMVRLQVAFGVPLAFFYGKCIVWDNCLQSWTHGHTDPLTGDISTYSLWVVGFLFMHSAITNWGRKT